MNEMDVKSLLMSFICVFLFRIEDIVFKWLQDRFQVSTAVSSHLQSMNDDELVAYIDFELAEYARRMDSHEYSDDRVLQTMELLPHTMNGCCLLHLHDYHLLPILCHLFRLLTRSSFALRRVSTLPRITALLQQRESVLKCTLSNALHVLYFLHYIHALGSVRFNRVQEFFMFFFSLYSSTVTPTDISLFAIQLCFRVLNPDDVYRDCLAFFMSGLREGLHDANPDVPTGMETMMTYFFFCLLSVVYDRNVISFDKDAIFTHRLINTTCQPENKTLEEVEESMQNYKRMDEEVFKALQTVATEQFDMDKAANVYQLKDDVVAHACVFNGYSSLLSQNAMIEVVVALQRDE